MGLDPGMTVGVAILDLSGEILDVNSFKEVSRAYITRHIINYGKTVLVATDVHNPPKLEKWQHPLIPEYFLLTVIWR